MGGFRHACDKFVLQLQLQRNVGIHTHGHALPTRVSVPDMPGFLCMKVTFAYAYLFREEQKILRIKKEKQKQGFFHMLNNNREFFSVHKDG